MEKNVRYYGNKKPLSKNIKVKAWILELIYKN